MISDFHDDLFASPKVKDETHVTDYQPKNCTEEWYMSEEQKGGEDGIQNLKFVADRAYSVANYKMALKMYKQILGRHSPPQMQRDLTEAVIRCQLHLGQLSESLTMAIEMNNSSKNNDHKTCSMMLLARVYRHNKDYSNEMMTYAGLIQFHPLNINFWAQFAEALATHWGISCTALPSACEDNNLNAEVSNSEKTLLSGLSQNTIYHVIGACFVRVRTIYESFSRHSQTSGLMENSELQAKVKKWLEILPLLQGFEQVTVQYLCRDVVGERDEVDEIEDLLKQQTLIAVPDNVAGATDDQPNCDRRQFYAIWFGWIEAYLNAYQPTSSVA